jgi:SNF2 family DNA or RNA helicase
VAANPLITEYAVSSSIRPDLRPFPAINPQVLDKLYLLRKWDITSGNIIPLKHPSFLREEIYDTDGLVSTGKPLTVKEFQKQAIYHLIKLPRFIEGDAVGLGKTLAAIAAFCWIKERNPEAKMVVITTKSTTHQWQDEIRRFSTLRPLVMKDTFLKLKSSEARYMQMVNFFETDEADVLIAKYDSLKGVRKVVTTVDVEGNETRKRERVSEEIRTFSKIFQQHGSRLVLTLDEAHRFKSTQSQVRNLVWNTSKHAERVWALTATVIKNGMDEFYSIASAIGIRPLGHMHDFHENYCLWRDQYIGNGRHKKVIVGYQNVADFKTQLRPFFLGRSQQQVNEPLPRLSTVYHPVELDAKQTRLLKDELPAGSIQLPPTLIKDAQGFLHEKDRDPDNLMTQLAVQALVANHWALLDRTNKKDFLTATLSPKEELLKDMLTGEYLGEKLIIFTKFRSWIDRLQWLTENGHLAPNNKFLRITGAENEAKRNENKKLFQNSASGYDSIFINSAGLEGINLQQAGHMVLLDVPWSWGSLLQLVGRMVRMSSPHTSCILHVVPAKGTIDEYALETLKGKKGVFEKILGDSHSTGILDSGNDLADLESGMEKIGTDEEFRSLLRSYAKKVGMGVYLSGAQIVSAQGQPELFSEDSFSKKKKGKSYDPDALQWFLEQ